MQYDLPYGVKVVVDEQLRERMVPSGGVCGSVSSNLAEHVARPADSPRDRQRLQGRAEALECFLLELACAGVNIGSAEFLGALEATVQALRARAASK